MKIIEKLFGKRKLEEERRLPERRTSVEDSVMEEVSNILNRGGSHIRAERAIEMSKHLVQRYAFVVYGRCDDDIFPCLVAGLAHTFDVEADFAVPGRERTKEEKEYSLRFALVNGSNLASRAFDNKPAGASLGPSYGLFYEALESRARKIGCDNFWRSYYDEKQARERREGE